MKLITGTYKFALVAIPLMPLLASGADSGKDPTGKSVAPATGPATPADNAAQAFSKTTYAFIPLQEPPVDGATHEYRVNCVTDRGEVDFTHWSNGVDPDDSYFWDEERLGWSQGTLNATTLATTATPFHYCMSMDRAGHYAIQEDLPDPNPDDADYPGRKGIFKNLADGAVNAEIQFPKYEGLIDTQIREWQTSFLGDGETITSFEATSAPIVSWFGFFPLEDGSAFGTIFEYRDYTMTKTYDGGSNDFTIKSNHSCERWGHWGASGSNPLLFDGAMTRLEVSNSSRFASMFGAGGMGNDAFFLTLDSTTNSNNQAVLTSKLWDKTGNALPDLAQAGMSAGWGTFGTSRNGHIARRMNDGCTVYQYPSKKTDKLPKAFGTGAGGESVQVNDVGDLLIQTAGYTANATADMLVRKFTDPATGKIVWGTRQFSDDTLPTGWSGLQIDALANAQSLAKQRELEAQTPSVYPPKPEDTPAPMLGGIAMKNGKQYPMLLLPVDLRDIKNLVPDDSDDVIIEPKATVLEQKDQSIAWIEPHGSEGTPNSPDMPQLVLRFCGTETMGLKIKWKLAVKYNRPRGSNSNEAQIREQDEVYIPKMVAGREDQPWKEEALDGAVEIYNNADWKASLVENGFFGGEAELKYQLLTSAGVAIGTETTMLFSIDGKNPDDPQCKTYIDTNATASDARLTRLSYAVAKHESKDYNGGSSRYNQFWEGYARRFQVNHRKGEPLWCKAPAESSAGGFASFQITGNLTSQFAIIPREQMWNWQKNTDAYIVFVKTGGSASKGSVMDRFFAAVARTYPTDSEAQTPPTSFAYDGGNYDAWEMGTITLYNGAGGCPKSSLKNAAGKMSSLINPWTYDTSKPSGSRWLYHPNSNSYLHEVIQEK